MGKIAFVFAGQGAQYSGMGKSLYEGSAAAKTVMDMAEAIRPGTLAQCFSGDMETLSRTVNTQPCLFAVDIACAAALNEHNVQADMTAGFSLGEVAAATHAGLFSLEDAMKLVCERARLMDEASHGKETAMAAILRLDADKVEALCAQAGDVWPVNYNCPGQTVVSGSLTGIERMEALVRENKGRAMRLKVSGAFHSPYMHPAAEGLKAYMRGMEFAQPKMPLYANATAQPYAEDAAQLLAAQVESPVKWEETVRSMIAQGVDTFIECGAGKTLSGLIAKIDPAVRVMRVEDMETLHAALQAMEAGA